MIHQSWASPASRNQGGANRSDLVAWWLTILPICLDYKGQSSIIFTAIYAAITTLSLAGAAYLCLKYGLPRNIKLIAATSISGAFVLTTATSSLVMGQTPESILRGIPPLLIFLFSLIAIGSLMNSGQRHHMFWKATLFAAFSGMLLNLGLVSILQGIDLSLVRYQILGGFTPILVATTVGACVYGRLPKWAVIAISINAVLILLSVTRTQIFVAGVTAMCLVAFGGLNLVRAPNLGRTIGLAAAALAAFITIAASLPGAPLERWATRLMITDEASRRIDITAMTRKAQTDYQLERMAERPVQALIGFGISARSEFSASGATVISAILGEEHARWVDSGVGHNNYIGSLYVGGTVAGSLLLVFKAWAFICSAKCIRLISRNPNQLASLDIAAPLAVIAYFAFGFLGGYFGSRSASACLAISIGITLWQLTEYSRTHPKRRGSS